MVEITRPGKNSLTIDCPVMPAAGTFGFGDLYRDLVDVEKLGALVTNPVTYQPWNPATGTRVVPLDAGVLVHTGLPNPGLGRVIARYRGLWKSLPIPVIVHLVSRSAEELQRCMEMTDREDSIAAVELGLPDDISVGDIEWLVGAALEQSEKPLLVRLPFTTTEAMARAASESGAAALVICAPPRGTARDSSGRLISGRVYGPLTKPIILRLVGQLARRAEIPVIGAGGIHSAQDARDYIEAGAVAVQVDSVTWIQPRMIELIARDLGGLVLTQPSGALLDEWHPGIGETELRKQKQPAKEAPEESQKERLTPPSSEPLKAPQNALEAPEESPNEPDEPPPADDLPSDSDSDKEIC